MLVGVLTSIAAQELSHQNSAIAPSKKTVTDINTNTFVFTFSPDDFMVSLATELVSTSSNACQKFTVSILQTNVWVSFTCV